MTDYTPNTGQVRNAYGAHLGDCRGVTNNALKEFDRWLNAELSKAWRKGRNDMGYMFGHYHDCAGWEDCYCMKHVNPYQDNSEITAFCGSTEHHERHTEPAGRYLPEFTCGGFYFCEVCYEAFYSMPHNHVCEGL